MGDGGFHGSVIQRTSSSQGCGGVGDAAEVGCCASLDLQAAKGQRCSELSDGEKAGTVSKYTNAQNIKNIFVLNFNKAEGGRGKGNKIASRDVVGASQAGAC